MGKPTGLAKEQRRALDRLRGVPGIERFYLAGGSAIASYHRFLRDVGPQRLYGAVAPLGRSLVSTSGTIPLARLDAPGR